MNNPTPEEATIIATSEYRSDAAFKIVELRNCTFRDAMYVIQAWEKSDDPRAKDHCFMMRQPPLQQGTPNCEDESLTYPPWLASATELEREARDIIMGGCCCCDRRCMKRNTCGCLEDARKIIALSWAAQNVQPAEPQHPLVIDRVTKRARLATQDDIHRMETICSSYDAILREFAERLRMAEYLKTQMETTYGR